MIFGYWLLGDLYESDFGNNYAICSNSDCLDSNKVNNRFQDFAELGVKGFESPCVLYNLPLIRKELSVELISQMQQEIFACYGHYDAELALAKTFNDKVLHVSERKYGLKVYRDIERELGDNLNTREKTKIICEEMKQQYNIVGILDKNELNVGLEIAGIPVIDISQAQECDVIIFVTVAKYWKEIYYRIKDNIDPRIEIYGLSGENLREKYKN